MVYSKEIKFSVKFCIKKGSWSEIVYQRVYKQQLVFVSCVEVAVDDLSNGTMDQKMTASNKFAPLFHAKQLLRKYPECSHNSNYMVFR